MRTTIDIADELAVRAKKLAAEERTSLKGLVEEGLRWVLACRSGPSGAPVHRLRGLGKHIWEDIDPDAYVREQREDWA